MKRGASKRKGKSTAEGKLSGILGKTSFSKDEEKASDASQEDISDDQKHYHKCEYCQNKHPDDYLKERRAARERKQRKHYETDLSISSRSRDGSDLSKCPTKNLHAVNPTACLSNKESAVMVTPKQSNSNVKNSPRAQPVQDFLIRMNENVETLEKMMKDRDYKVTTSEEGISAHTPNTPSPSAVHLTPKNKVVTEFSPKQHATNELFSIKEVDQSASFGENSQVDPKHLNFENSATKGNIYETTKSNNTVPTAGHSVSPPQGFVSDLSSGQLKITLMFRGKLHEKSWTGKSEYIRVLNRVRQLFTS